MKHGGDKCCSDLPLDPGGSGLNSSTPGSHTETSVMNDDTSRLFRSAVTLM